MAYFWQVITLIIKYGPTIWKVVQEIITLINSISQYMTATDSLSFKSVQMSRMDGAVRYYKICGDKVKLHELHGELTCQLMNVKAHK